MSRLKRLIHEIHQRSLWQILLIYIGVSWGVLEAADLFAERLGLADWLFWVALGLLVTGLVILLVLAFLPEPAVPPTEQHELHLVGARRAPLLTWRRAATTFVVALAAWGVVATGWLLFGRTESASYGERPSIAVLPLVNRSGLEDDRYFTDGVHDEILTQLSKISGLSVRARTSVMEYRDSPKNIRQIGEELDARFLVEGGVQRAGANVRINIQLVDSQTDEHVFADTYDRELSLENLLAVQRELALRIADALKATLTVQEREQIEKVPTENLEAYDHYLLGMEYWGRLTTELDDFQNAQMMFERAVELDPRFALAYARLSRLHTSFYWFALDRSEERARLSLQAAERALQIDADLAEGHLALGLYYYQVHREYERALEEFAIAERGLPGEVTLLHWRGMIWRRQGKFDEALASLERAAALNPRSLGTLSQLASTYSHLRRYEEAEAYYDRVLALRPDYVEAAVLKALVSLRGRGDTRPGRALVQGVPPGVDPSGFATGMRFFMDYLDRDYASALEVLVASELDYFELQDLYAPKTLPMAACYAKMGEADRARAAADSARRDIEARLVEGPDDPRLHQALSQAHAILGNRDEAVRSAQRAVELLPISRDAMQGPAYVVHLAETYASFGEVEAAVEQYDLYLSVPAPRSITSILRAAAVDPIRDDPRFQALVAKYE
jgi:serine/threonine-protein kinase